MVIQLKASYDVAIIGSGFAGSIMAMVARRLGHSVVLLERASHPRVVIGESSTPLSNLLLQELAIRYDLPFLIALTKWGSWQQSYPELACGLKRGFSFFHHEAGEKDSRTYLDRQLFVAASPHDAIADTHWFRAELDQFLVEQARLLGVDYLDHVELTSCNRKAGGWNLTGNQYSRILDVEASFLIDATGPRGFLHRALHLDTETIPGFPPTCSLYSHFTGVHKFKSANHWPFEDAPYAVDDAAVHHVFDGGWIWILRFNNGWTSAGVAATRQLSNELDFAEGELAWNRLLKTLPLVKAQFADAKLQLPFKYVPQLSFLSSSIAGEHWAMLPTAAGFVDPLLSTGIPLALLGIARLGKAMETHWNSPQFAVTLETYAKEIRSEVLATANLIGALYRSMGDFSAFRSLSLLYFAAASYSETSRRLDKPELAPGFLLYNHPVFGPAFRQILASAEPQQVLEKQIYQLIDHFDVAGLCAKPADYSYPVRADDLFASAYKVGATTADIQRLLERSGFLSETRQPSAARSE